MNIQKIDFPIPKSLLYLSKILLKNGDEIRLVGGCIRDFLMGKRISDIDLVCKYKPDELVKILNQHKIKNITTAAKYGTIIAVIDGENFEITTLRKDVKHYGRQAEVEFTDDFYLDATRRDFTINAFYLDFEGNCYDYLDGLKDLKNRCVKFIGDPEERIKEDYLRILRFFRFSCYYSNNLDKKSLSAAVKLKDNITSLSADRIRTELIKIINHSNNTELLKILDVMNDNHILEIIFDNKTPNLKALTNLLILEKNIDNYTSNNQTKIASLISEDRQLNNTESATILNKLNFSNKDKQYIFLLNSPLEIDLNIDKKQLLFLLYEHDPQFLIDFLAIKFATQESSNDSDIKKFEKLTSIILSADLPKFPLNGHDLLAIHINPKNIGEKIIKARKYWIDNNFHPNKTDLISFLKQK